jgi:hypothetical protein
MILCTKIFELNKIGYPCTSRKNFSEALMSCTTHATWLKFEPKDVVAETGSIKFYFISEDYEGY